MTTTLEQKYENRSYVYDIYPSFFLVKKNYELESKRVIDLWASDGRYLKHFWEGSVGVEYGDVDRKKAKSAGLNVVFGNFNKDFAFFPDESFDFIFSSHVIEHLESPYLFLKRIRWFGGNDARLILWYPLENSLVRLFDPYFAHDGHIYSFSKANIEKLLLETGFAIEKIYYDIPFAGRFTLCNYLQKSIQTLPYWMVSWWANALYIVAKKI